MFATKALAPEPSSMQLKSQTWNELKLLLQELSPRRLRFLGMVLMASFVQGLIDILLVGLLARLVGLLAGAKLGDQIPGIRFFGGGLLDQAGWIVALLIAAYWLASGIRFGVALLESLLTAEIWSDLVNKVYRNLMLQRYEFFMHIGSPVSWPPLCCSSSASDELPWKPIGSPTTSQIPGPVTRATIPNVMI